MFTSTCNVLIDLSAKDAFAIYKIKKLCQNEQFPLPLPTFMCLWCQAKDWDMVY